MDEPISKSSAEAREAERHYHRSLTPAERIQIVLTLREQYRVANGLTNKMQRVCRIMKLDEALNAKKEVE